MAERFGDLLRRQRREANKTLGDLARILGTSVVYVSDVERGNRKPFSNDRIIRIGVELGVDPMEMIRAAEDERGTIEYDISDVSALERDVVSGLVAGLQRGGVTLEQLEDIQNILEKGEKSQ